jgi:hypothetical protein
MATFMRLDSLKAEHLSYKQKMSVQFGLGAPPGKVLRPHSPLGTAKFQFDSGCPDQQAWCSDSTKRRQRLGSGLIPDVCSSGIGVKAARQASNLQVSDRVRYPAPG